LAEGIIFIGAGNAAWQLASAFSKAGYNIDEVIAKTEESAKALASKFGAYFGTLLSSSAAKSDWIFICTPDDVIPQIVDLLKTSCATVIHISGATPLSVFPKGFGDCGVLYPVQTFSKRRKINMQEVPLVLEASDVHTEKRLQHLAESISGKVFFANSEERRMLHLAAVFTNNFTNHFYTIARGLLTETRLPVAILNPLIGETALKAITEGSENVQTGPAKRGDQNTMNTQLQWLKEHHPELEEIYEQISGLIGKHFS
jgi:predicted short-subunit dehydrogenase-like oxidoreductase (DUF2520 family)